MPSRDARFVEFVPHGSAQTADFQHHPPLSFFVMKARCHGQVTFALPNTMNVSIAQ
jgi:hypothetical protein